MKLSVAIITYNHERFIAQAIQSVLDQSLNSDYEIVIGEDCSTDRTREIIMDFYRRYPDLIVPIFRDRNIGGKRNFIGTLASCRGQYVAFLEGDDYWVCSDKLRRQIDFLDSHPDYAISCGRVTVLDESETAPVDIMPLDKRGAYTIEKLLRCNFVMTCTVMCRRTSVEHLPNWFLRIEPGDWALFALIAQFGKIDLADEILAAYRAHPGGVWSSRPPVNRLKDLVCMLEMLDRSLNFRYTDTIKETIASYCLELGSVAFRNGNRFETGLFLLKFLWNGGGKLLDLRPTVKGLVWYTLLGSWHPVFAKAKRAILG